MPNIRDLSHIVNINEIEHDTPSGEQYSAYIQRRSSLIALAAYPIASTLSYATVLSEPTGSNMAVGWVKSSQAEASSNGLVALIGDQLRVRNLPRASDSGVIVTAIDNIGGSEGVVSRCHRAMILIGARVESSNVIGGVIG